MIISVDTCDYYQSCFLCDKCDCDAENYYIYYSQTLTDDLQLIDSIDYMYNDTVYFYHENLEAVVGCYGVKAVDSLGNISNMSNVVCIDYEECPAFEIPNVFTPNGDNYNDILIPFSTANIERIDLKIFNRWGKIMYETDDPEINWDGKNQNNNQDCPAAPYFYVCDVYIVTIEGLKKQTLQGSVTIVRGNQ